MSELVTREDRGRVSILTLNNPPANGYSHAMHKALDAHVLDLRMDKGTDVIVLRGAGERFFCAGADIGYLQTLDPDDKYAFCLHANETLLRLENTPKLVIAALNGHCVGGGLEIALACDLRVGRASGVKPNLVGLPEVTLGVLPGTGGTQRLTRVLGRARALQWMVEGRNVSVEEAVAIGLVHQVLPEHGWWEAVLAYAATFTRPGRAAGAVGLIKRAVVGGADLPLEAGLALERELQMRLFAAPDAKEGLAAFLEKRPATFTGAGMGERAATASAASAAPAAAMTPRAAPERHRASEEAEPGFGTGDRPRGEEGRLPGEIDLHRTRIPDAVLNLLGRSIVERYLVLPVKRTETTILVAMADPSDTEALDAIREETGLEVHPVRASELDIAVMVARYYRA